jgi:hypothetical protein
MPRQEKCGAKKPVTEGDVLLKICGSLPGRVAAQPPPDREPIHVEQKIDL